MSYLGQSPFQEFTNPPTKDSFTGDGSTVAFDMSAAVASNAQNALEVYVNNVRQEPGTGKAFTLGVDGSNANKRITFTAAPANGAAIYVINDKTNTSVTAPLSNDLNGTELILDGDGDTSITADTDDRIDFKLAGVEHISIGNSSGDTIIKTRVDAKDIMFQQFDGRDVLEINDAGFVALHNGDSGSGQLRIYEDDDNGANFTAFQVGTQSADITYTLPTADGSSGQAITTNGSGVLSFATVAANTPTSADGQALGSASLEWSDLFLADSSTIQFGADQDTILTHTDGSGLTLNSTNKLMFNDASQFIHAPSATVLDIGATDEIELTATLIDVVGNFTNSGTIVSAGIVTAAGFTIGSAVIGEAELEILDGATVTTTELNLIDGDTSRGTTAVASGDGILINDAGTMRMTNVDTVSTYFASHTVGGGNIVTTGALGSGSIAAGFGAIDNGTSGIRTNTFTAETAFVPDASGGADLGTTSLEFNDAFFNDGAVINFGDDQDVKLTHTADTGLTLNSTMKLMFNDASQFIQGTSATVLSIAATDEIDLTATAVDLNGTLNVSGVATFQATPVFPDGSLAVADLDIDGATDIGAAIVDADLFIVDDGAGGANRKTTAARIKTYAATSGDVTTIDSLLKADIKIGEDDQTKIDFETADQINFYAANVNQVKLIDNVFAPVADSDVDLGTSSLYFKDTFLDTIRTTGVSVFGSATSTSAGGYTGTVQVQGAGANSTMSLNGNANNDGGVAFILSKSRNATVGTNTIVQDNDVVASIVFAADDGTNMDSQPANIVCKINGTPGQDDVPGELIFGTTADGASNPTARLTLDAAGDASFTGNIKVVDDKYLVLGTGDDFCFGLPADEARFIFSRGSTPSDDQNARINGLASNSTTQLDLRAGEGKGPALVLLQDQGDDNADLWAIGQFAGDNGANTSIHWTSYTSGSWVNKMRLNTSAVLDVAGAVNASATLDYAEYFEWKTELANDAKITETYGMTVVLDGNKVRLAKTGEEAKVLGVVRPTGTSAMVGGSESLAWKHQYEKNVWGESVYEEYTLVKWVEKDADGKITKRHSYHKDRIPAKVLIEDIYLDKSEHNWHTLASNLTSDNLVVPSTAAEKSAANYVEKTTYKKDKGEYKKDDKLMRRKINSSYDSTKTYVGREQRRKEWCIVGLLGQVEVRAAAIVPTSWTKMKNLETDIDMYYIK